MSAPRRHTRPKRNFRIHSARLQQNIPAPMRRDTRVNCQTHARPNHNRSIPPQRRHSRQSRIRNLRHPAGFPHSLHRHRHRSNNNRRTRPQINPAILRPRAHRPHIDLQRIRSRSNRAARNHPQRRSRHNRFLIPGTQNRSSRRQNRNRARGNQTSQNDIPRRRQPHIPRARIHATPHAHRNSTSTRHDLHRPRRAAKHRHAIRHRNGIADQRHMPNPGSHPRIHRQNSVHADRLHQNRPHSIRHDFVVHDNSAQTPNNDRAIARRCANSRQRRLRHHRHPAIRLDLPHRDFHLANRQRDSVKQMNSSAAR